MRFALFNSQEEQWPTPELRSTVEILRARPDHFVALNAETRGRFQIGSRERYLLRLMDGTHTTEEIRRDYAERFGEELMTRTLGEFLGELDGHGMLVGSDLPEAAPVVRIPTVPRPLSREDPGGRVNRRFDLLVLF